MRKFYRLIVLLSSAFAAPVFADPVTLPQLRDFQGHYVPSIGAVPINPDGTSASAASAAASTPLVATVMTTGFVGPWAPQLGRPIWLTVTGIWSGNVIPETTFTNSCSDAVPIDQKGYILGVSGSSPAASAVSAPVGTETRADAKWCLSVAVNSGTPTLRLSQ